MTAIDATTHAWTASRRRDVDRLVRIAKRHSRLVRIGRIALPIAIVLALTALTLNAYFEPMQMFDKPPSVNGKLGVQGKKITMELPKIAGFTRDSRAYEMTAETAIQDMAQPELVELKNLRATVELPDANAIQITAASGAFNTKADVLVMHDKVMFSTAHGYRGKLRRTTVEMKIGRIVSEEPVELTLPDGLLKANRMEILNSGEVILFEKGVVLTLDGDAPPAERAPR
jgi:lipopolysaccharide export system protein LptC